MNIFYNFISSDSNTIYNPNFNTGAEDCDSGHSTITLVQKYM